MGKQHACGDYMLINPETEKMETALAYLRWCLEESYERERRRLVDFDASAEELAGKYFLCDVSTERIETYRGVVDDLFPFRWGYAAYEQASAAIISYTAGETDFAALAAALNAIYA